MKARTIILAEILKPLNPRTLILRERDIPMACRVIGHVVHDMDACPISNALLRSHAVFARKAETLTTTHGRPATWPTRHI